jgi:hypothetical protein
MSREALPGNDDSVTTYPKVVVPIHLVEGRPFENDICTGRPSL